MVEFEKTKIYAGNKMLLTITDLKNKLYYEQGKLYNIYEFIWYDTIRYIIHSSDSEAGKLLTKDEDIDLVGKARLYKDRLIIHFFK